MYVLVCVESICILLGLLTRKYGTEVQTLGVITSVPYTTLITSATSLTPIQVYADAPAATKEMQLLSETGLLGTFELGDATVVGLYLDNSYYCAINTETVAQLQQYFKDKLSEVQALDSGITAVLYDKSIRFGALSNDFDVAYVKTAEEVIARFESDTVAYKAVEIKPNDTLGTIAKDLGISIDDLQGYRCMFNGTDVYNWTENNLIVGAKIQVPYTVPYMNLQYCKQAQDMKFIPYETVEVYDDTMFDDEMIELTAGGYGILNRELNLTYTLDGTVVAQEVVNTEMVQQPTTCVIKVGTKERVEKADYTKETPVGSYVYPVEYADSRITAYQGDGRGHKGIDIAAPYGTPIYAATAGKVTRADSDGWNGGYGIVIEIDNDDGLNCRYAHLSYLNVSEGADVVKGQLIGYVGSTGDSTGNHLHFEVYTDTEIFKNPMSYIYIPE